MKRTILALTLVGGLGAAALAASAQDATPADGTLPMEDHGSMMSGDGMMPRMNEMMSRMNTMMGRCDKMMSTMEDSVQDEAVKTPSNG